MQSIGGRGDLDRNAGVVGRGSDEAALSGSEALGGKFHSDRNRDRNLFAGGVGERVGGGIEIDASGQRHGDDGFRRRDEREGRCESVVALREVAVVGGDDDVGVAFLDIAARPLADARTTCIGENGRPDLFEIGEKAVALDGGADLFGTGGHEKRSLGAKAVLRCEAGDGGGAADVLVGGVRAGADEGRRDLHWPAFGLGFGAEFAHLAGAVGSVRAVDEGLERGEVDLDDLIEVLLGIGENVVIGAQVGGDSVGGLGGGSAVGGLEIARHGLVIREE
ncbi:unannotated protein [freshwater metagenome]|uniref:Unannotated protein n=1 Tax=freshwater metagenome TaxID=449393 RepID=A0A6J6H860_9ZZZZ